MNLLRRRNDRRRARRPALLWTIGIAATLATGRAHGQDTRPETRAAAPEIVEFSDASPAGGPRIARPRPAAATAMTADEAAEHALESLRRPTWAGDSSDCETFGAVDVPALLRGMPVPSAPAFGESFRYTSKLMRPWHVGDVVDRCFSDPAMVDAGLELLGDIARSTRRADAATADALQALLKEDVRDPPTGEERYIRLAESWFRRRDVPWSHAASFAPWLARAVEDHVVTPEGRRRALSALHGVVRLRPGGGCHADDLCSVVRVRLARLGVRTEPEFAPDDPLEMAIAAWSGEKDAIERVVDAADRSPWCFAAALALDGSRLTTRIAATLAGGSPEDVAGVWRVVMTVSEEPRRFGVAFGPSFVDEVTGAAATSPNVTVVQNLELMRALPRGYRKRSIEALVERVRGAIAADPEAIGRDDVRAFATVCDVHDIDGAEALRQVAERGDDDARAEALLALAVFGDAVGATSVDELLTASAVDSPAFTGAVAALSSSNPRRAALIAVVRNPPSLKVASRIVCGLAAAQGVPPPAAADWSTEYSTADSFTDAVIDGAALAWATSRVATVGTPVPAGLSRWRRPELRAALRRRLDAVAPDDERLSALAAAAAMGDPEARAEAWRWMQDGRHLWLENVDEEEATFGWDSAAVAWWLDAVDWNANLVHRSAGFLFDPFDGADEAPATNDAGETVSEAVRRRVHGVSSTWRRSRLDDRFHPVAH
ncbi:MAG TPA: hypothetical protein VEI02_17080 [Planctomycetota bacterium]|nr:hypothetical protein [Planctomycetota bacterium]